VVYRITDKLVKALKAPDTGNRIVYDDQLAGFGVRITSNHSRVAIPAASCT
jgi:hypothetical protein